ncbi:DUF3558 family protein [Amycolatopsis saalfeldensis]|uniref:DUF3558 domain-containing protein n=1 Tax=Amycolatopsis saalfeldensis TaxID=394193 RepID=A0A1H8XFR3_9PSEU|nr:DUF3558 family protein [Amycolatopsis saalfeldensis]SEP38088.1 Protein of unknown function [Amycolatopsis saalfeldensis]
MRRVMVTAVVLACVLGLSACGGDPPGSARPATGGSTAPAGGSGRTGTPFAGTDPCALFKPADLQELDQDPEATPERRTDLYPVCAGSDYSIAVIDDNPEGRVMDFEGSLAKPVPDIAGHHAVTTIMHVGSSTNCSVSMEVTADEYVRVGITTHDNDSARMCALAVRAATVVASRIPA